MRIIPIFSLLNSSWVSRTNPLKSLFLVDQLLTELPARQFAGLVVYPVAASVPNSVMRISLRVNCMSL